MAIPLMQVAKSMLDMGTGGGELLSMLRPWPKSVCATEGYRPNLSVAKERFEPPGVTVLFVEDDEHLPFETKYEQGPSVPYSGREGLGRINDYEGCDYWQTARILPVHLSYRQLLSRGMF
ncbi:hypothetical protein DFP94_1086 [Fontibacillus phaseoli]|uniref:Uncharacterized protein n=1 Tax=Fontibacillus phaseoli TaxID=1416533 RepID=A0A369BAM3_9BACL|nr:hypothetical protein DFP94_1086 [Fontibacillus phaseoli]